MKLGDLAYTITRYTGVHWIVKRISKWRGKDCGCDRRREEWNDIELNVGDRWKNWIG